MSGTSVDAPVRYVTEKIICFYFVMGESRKVCAFVELWNRKHEALFKTNMSIYQFTTDPDQSKAN